MRRRYRYNAQSQKMEEVTDSRRAPASAMVTPSFEEFRSPVDGTVIVGRRALREHNKRHNVTNVSDFTGQWQRQADQRAQLFNADPRFDRKDRLEAIKHAVEKDWRK